MVRTLLRSLCALLVFAPAAHASWTAPALLSGCPRVPPGSELPPAAAQVAPIAPLIVYPSSEPQVRSGVGALLWNATGRCARGAPEVFGAPLGAGGLPGAGQAVDGRTGSARSSGGGAGPTGALAAVSAAVGTAAGQVLALGSAPGGAGALVEGGLPGTFPASRSLGGPAAPVAAVSGYLGDAVVVSIEKSPPRARARALTNPPRVHARGWTNPPRAPAKGSTNPPRAPAKGSTNPPRAPAKGSTNPPRVRARAAGPANDIPKHAPWALDVRIQRHYSATPQPPLVLPVGSAPPVALAVAIDFRSDLLLVWAAQGAIYARELTQSGVAEPVRRLASVAGIPELRALYSDDGRAIVAWREQRGPRTSIQVSISDATLRFGAPHTVERFTDLTGLVPQQGSLRLVRLSSEAVMMAWTGMRAGRYVVRASPVSLRRGVWAPVVISGPLDPPRASGLSRLPGAARPGGTPGSVRDARPTQALLADLVPGPRAEVLALWTAAPLVSGGVLDPRRRAIVAAWGHYGGPGEARFAPPETVSAPGPNGMPAAAFDPQNDRALAAWVTGTSSPRIAYSQRSAGPPEGSTLATARPYRALSAVHRTGTPRAGEGGVRPVWFSALGLLMIAVAGAVRQLSARRRGIRSPRGPARWEGRVRVPRERARRRLWRHERR